MFQKKFQNVFQKYKKKLNCLKYFQKIPKKIKCLNNFKILKINVY